MENKSKFAARNQAQHHQILNTTPQGPMDQQQPQVANGPTTGTVNNTDKQSMTKMANQRQSMQMINQKGAAPITDIRAKRQAATLNVEDLNNSNNNNTTIQAQNIGNQAFTSSIVTHNNNNNNNLQSSIGSL